MTQIWKKILLSEASDIAKINGIPKCFSDHSIKKKVKRKIYTDLILLYVAVESFRYKIEILTISSTIPKADGKQYLI